MQQVVEPRGIADRADGQGARAALPKPAHLDVGLSEQAGGELASALPARVRSRDVGHRSSEPPLGTSHFEPKERLHAFRVVLVNEGTHQEVSLGSRVRGVEQGSGELRRHVLAKQAFGLLRSFPREVEHGSRSRLSVDPSGANVGGARCETVRAVHGQPEPLSGFGRGRGGRPADRVGPVVRPSDAPSCEHRGVRFLSGAQRHGAHASSLRGPQPGNDRRSKRPSFVARLSTGPCLPACSTSASTANACRSVACSGRSR